MLFDGISIIIPFHKDLINITRCLDAISQATSRLCPADRLRLEIIVVDDASPEPFSYQGPRADLICHRLKNNSGVGAARNAGARLAKYEYLMFIDSDVFLAADHLVIVFNILRKKAIKILQGTTSIEPGNKNPNLFHHYMAISWYFFQSKYSRYFLATLCMVVNRKFFFQKGGFPESYPDSGGEEFEFSALIHKTDRDAIDYNHRLTFYHNYSGLYNRLKKILVRSSRLKPFAMPRAFQIEAGIRGAGATLMTLALLLFLVNPLWAGMAYVSLGVLLFIADWELSKYFIRHHSWRLALASVFFRQIEYSTVICGVITGFFRKK